jgi:chaperonin GroES
VIKVGNGRISAEGVRIVPTVKEGDVVLYNVGAAVSVTLNKEAYLIIKEEDILAVIN